MRARSLRRVGWLLCPVLLLALADCASRTKAPAAPAGRVGVLEVHDGYASYYGEQFHGRLTASGVRFDMHAMVAAHPSYPFGTIVRVTNMRNRRSVRVRIVDRGPAAGPRSDGVLIDLSYGAAKALRFLEAGRTRVRIEVLRWGGSAPGDPELQRRLVTDPRVSTVKFRLAERAIVCEVRAVDTLNSYEVVLHGGAETKMGASPEFKAGANHRPRLLAPRVPADHEQTQRTAPQDVELPKRTVPPREVRPRHEQVGLHAS